MKKKIVFVAMSFLLLTGCGKEKEMLSKETEPETVEESSSAVVELDEDYIQGLLRSQVIEYPVTVISETTWSTEETKEYTLFMVECNIDEITSDLLTAHGVLRNDYFATQDEIAIQYSLVQAEDGTYWITEAQAPQEKLMLIPTSPFTIDMLREYITEIWVYVGDEVTEYPMDDSFTVELDPNGWKTNFFYGGNVWVTDGVGNKYCTEEGDQWGIYYSQQPYSEESDPYQWFFGNGTSFVDAGILIVKLVE